MPWGETRSEVMMSSSSRFPVHNLLHIRVVSRCNSKHPPRSLGNHVMCRTKRSFWLLMGQMSVYEFGGSQKEMNCLTCIYERTNDSKWIKSALIQFITGFFFSSVFCSRSKNVSFFYLSFVDVLTMSLNLFQFQNPTYAGVSWRKSHDSSSAPPHSQSFCRTHITTSKAML